MFTPKPLTFKRGKMDYLKSYHPVKEEESILDRNFKENIDLSEHISEWIRRIPMLERKSRSNREGSHSRSSDIAASTLSSIKDKHLNPTQQIGQSIHRIGNQNFNNKRGETSSDQLPQQGYANMTGVPHRFYTQVRYNEQLKACVFTDASEPILADTSMYIIFHETTKEILDKSRD